MENTTVNYYSIDENAARRAKEMNSFDSYVHGSATSEYKNKVDKAAAIASRQKECVDQMYHEKIDRLLDSYARKLAQNMNHGFEIDARVPSILIAGGGNFPAGKKEKQNAARDKNMQEYNEIQNILDRIRSVGTGGISSDDPDAVEKLKAKLNMLEKSQAVMKAVNAYYRKNGTLDGCPDLAPDEIGRIQSEMASGCHYGNAPFLPWKLSNNNAEIRRIKQRIERLARRAETTFAGWQFDGGYAEPSKKDNRLRIFFDGKPDEKTRSELKQRGFKWSPKAGAWQRQLSMKAYYAADDIQAIQPTTGESPTELQKRAMNPV